MVAPVRWATPGTDVDCAIQPSPSPSATIQSTSTPPPWPPIAKTAMLTGLAGSSVDGGSVAFISLGPFRPERCGAGRVPVAPPLEEADYGGACPCQQAVERIRVMDDVGAIEGGAKYG